MTTFYGVFRHAFKESNKYVVLVSDFSEIAVTMFEETYGIENVGSVYRKAEFERLRLASQYKGGILATITHESFFTEKKREAAKAKARRVQAEILAREEKRKRQALWREHYNQR